MAQWIRRSPTKREIPGSIPGVELDGNGRSTIILIDCLACVASFLPCFLDVWCGHNMHGEQCVAGSVYNNLDAVVYHQ